MKKNKIRVAVLSDGNELYAWQYKVLQDIQNSNYSSLIVNIKKKTNSYTIKRQWAWNMFRKLDYLLFRPSPNAMAPLSYATSFFKENLVYISENNINTKELREYNLDVIINFSNSSPTAKLTSLSKFGIWDLVHSDTKNNRKGPPGVWELILGLPMIEASLIHYSSGTDHPEILDRTIACTDWISYSRNANIIYWQAYPLINRNLKRLFEDRELKHTKKNIWKEDIPQVNTPYEYPCTRVLLRHTVKTIFKKITQLITNNIYFDQWILIINNSRNSSQYDLSHYKRILPPKDRFWADPFLIKRNGKYYIFMEELIYKKKIGHLAVMELDEKGNYTTPKTILKKPYHLSYPFLFEDQGHLYMIPETAEAKEIQLYKCTNFPYEWQLEKVLMKDIIAVDATVYKKDGLYWMFTNLKVAKGMSSNIELFLFYSKELVSDEWTPHPMNPIVTDIQKARPAGQLFLDKGNLMRPSQNCSHHYGYGLSINEITRMDKSNFEEVTLNSIKPDWQKDVFCTHTYNSCDNIFISDVQIKRRRFF